MKGCKEKAPRRSYSTDMEKRAKQIRTIKILHTLAVIAGLLAVLSLLYPKISDAWNRYVASQMITQYEEVLVEKEEEQSEAIKQAQQYNEDLFKMGDNNIGAFAQRQQEEESDPEYESKLANTNMMAYVTIPKIYVSIPIKHYTTDEVLKDSIGHIYGTSLPVGGPSTHAAVSGHNALLTARLFTDLEKLELGDQFSIHVGGQKLNYEIGQIKTVLPSQVEDLRIEEGKDYVTLSTCTPYGVNTHRILMRGERIADDINVNTQLNYVDTIVKAPVFIFAVTGALLLLAIVLIVYIWRAGKPKKAKRQESTKEETPRTKEQ